VGAGGALQPKRPATVPAGVIPSGIAASPDGASIYVANTSDNTVSQYDVGAGGALEPKGPATVAAGVAPDGVAVTPIRVPTSKDQCKHGGWRIYGVFKNQGDCVSWVATGGKNPPGKKP
jgi:streptogramin lyase